MGVVQVDNLVGGMVEVEITTIMVEEQEGKEAMKVETQGVELEEMGVK